MQRVTESFVTALSKSNQDLLAEFSRGGALILDNAEQLYREACILRDHGALSRALCLHQLSKEECGKLELLGGYAVSIASGDPVNLKLMAKTLRDHRAKNNANAYFAGVTEHERAARERKDWTTASRAFDKLKATLHDIFNTNKNAALYVGFEKRKFVAPKDVITEELVEDIAALNQYFLSLTGGVAHALDRANPMADALAEFRRL